MTDSIEKGFKKKTVSIIVYVMRQGLNKRLGKNMTWSIKTSRRFMIDCDSIGRNVY